MKTKHVRPNCPFFNDECKHKECPSYVPARPMTEPEKQAMAMRDWPVSDPYVRDWCSKYNMSVNGFITIIKE